MNARAKKSVLGVVGGVEQLGPWSAHRVDRLEEIQRDARRDADGHRDAPGRLRADQRLQHGARDVFTHNRNFRCAHDYIEYRRNPGMTELHGGKTGVREALHVPALHAVGAWNPPDIDDAALFWP